jgi:hypothetical protein
VFLYIKSEQSKNEIKETIPFAIASKRIKYLSINLTKEMEDLYTKQLLKEMKGISRWKDILL